MTRGWSVIGGLFALLGHAANPMAPVNQLTVHLITGIDDLSPGSVVELRIYELGGAVRRLPLNHGEDWPADSTRDITLQLGAPLDPRKVVRYGIYYHSAKAESRPWQIVSADAFAVPSEHAAPLRLIDATVTGLIDGQGEIDTAERPGSELACATDADCDDHRSCNGREHCAPGRIGADARGCVPGTPVICPVNQICTEARGCVGPTGPVPGAPKPQE